MPIFPFLYTFSFSSFFVFPLFAATSVALPVALAHEPKCPNQKRKRKEKQIQSNHTILNQSLRSTMPNLFLLGDSHVQHFDSSASLGGLRHKLVQTLVRSRFSVADHLPLVVVFHFLLIDRFDVAQDLRLGRVGCFGRRRRFGRFSRVGSFCRSSRSSRRRRPSSCVRAAPRSLELVRLRIASSG